ncbi:GH1 family beta-glucosidase [Actinoallomurus rhizosphaericola]|uniref:GH1 family beta-glucosidase n=1 Tax=Actinoallomurus rhizosphaericola TaxID=2952536 RepID=UPI002092D79E|nr:GH1 family beta-glucosidase [Actinoallomurus rhizosphaericola]MCO5994900.1 GH1 family beta-glucosidase [Actinoallomurus rhizosphaericola]
MFPPDFHWGVATSAYQIEGATEEDGRGPSTWDTFCREPGRVRDGHTADVACDHYHRWAEDLDLIAGLGARAYRFSVAWPRVQPTGGGPVNPKGLDFYDRLVDGLAERGVAAVPTLYHWDLPQPLEDAGGWMNRDTAHRFAEYAAIVADRLADRVDLWITLNEPMVVMAYGYAFGIYAPGRTLMLGALPTAHHQLLGHGLATAALRAAGARRVGIANHYTPAWPAGDTAEDATAAAAFDDLLNWQFTDPILRGHYPALGLDLSHVRDGDLELIRAPIDVLGVNYYHPTGVAAPTDDSLPFAMRDLTGYPTTGMGWPVVPDGLHRLLVDLRDRYGAALPPVYITESGCSYDESLDDSARIGFLTAHVGAVQAAMNDGVDVRGYYVWSLLDNFEWAEGFHPRFGLVHVDYATQRRTPRASYAWYRDLIAAASS